MTPLFAAFPALTPGFVLPILAVVACIAGGVVLYNVVQSKTAVAIASEPMPNSVAGSFFSHIKNWHLSPEMQLIGKALASRLKDFGDATGHQLFDSVLLSVLPKSAPLVPAINKGLDAIEGKLAGSSAPNVSIPPGHPVLDLLQKVLEASHQQQAPAAKP